MGLRRREPARLRLGNVACVPDGSQRAPRKKSHDPGDLAFLERVFHKLMLNFTWWVNRKDTQGRNIFQGGFLGLDNIGVFDRSAPFPTGGFINQADGTSWMAMYSLNLMASRSNWRSTTWFMKTSLNEVADELSRRLANPFLKGDDGQRPVLKYHPKLATDPHFMDYVLFHGYFHGDNGRGVGASHQTGWTGLVAKLLQPRNMSAKKTGAPKRAKAAAKPRAQEPALVKT